MSSPANTDESEGRKRRRLSNEDYTVGWICAIATEYVAAKVFLDQEHAPPAYTATHDNNDYTLGRIGHHNVAIAVLPGGEYGTASAAGVARDMLHSFPNIRIGLMVGIGGGAPSSKHDIRLGDVIVSEPQNGLGGVFQYDFGKNIQDQPFQNTRFLAPPPQVLLTALNGLKSEYKINGHKIQEQVKARLLEKSRLQKEFSRPSAETDRLYQPSVVHPLNAGACLSHCGNDAMSLVIRTVRDDKVEDDPAIHYGLIGSANQLMKDAKLRDQYASERGILCFEMEAGGLMNHFPCLIIRGICDYSDTHKNKEWQGYAAMTAAAYAKDLLKRISPNKLETEQRLSELLGKAISVSLSTKLAVQDLQRSAHFEEIIKWLSAPDPSINLNKARDLHQLGTGQWLLDNAKYRSWRVDPGSFLWLHGRPGCGKTILSSTIIANLKEDIPSQNILYFYFDFTDVEKRSTDKAVRSLIEQLYRKSAEAQEVVDSLYAKYKETGQQPSIESLRTVLETIIAKCHDAWIIFDGLDECEKRVQHTDSVLPWIKTLRLRNVHMLVTSRPEDDIKSYFKAWVTENEMMSLQSSLVAEDIGSYIRAKVEQMDRWRTRPDIHALILTTLNERANGMFRWVACQFDILQECLKPADVQRALNTLPRTLDETYARILQRLQPEYLPDAIRLLQLLTYSERPILIEEAVDAIAVEPASKPRFDPANRMPVPEEITRYCSSLVSINYSYRGKTKQDVLEIQLAHFSVQEYLQSDRLGPSMAKHFNKTAAATAMVELCLSYLLAVKPSHSLRTVEKQYPFALFSAQYWSAFAAVVESSSQRVPEILNEYYASRNTFALGYEIYSPDLPALARNTESSDRPVWERNTEEVSPLYYASFIGLTASVHALLEMDANTNVQCGLLRNPLQAAASKGHETIVDMLLQNGADVNAQGGMHGNALFAASQAGYEGIARKLIQAGADVNAIGGLDSNALYAASEGGYEGIARALIHAGADVNAQGGNDSNALYVASLKGHAAIAQMLIKSGADVNAQCKFHYNRSGGFFHNALCAASVEGHQDIAQMLIESGADVNAQGGTYDNALLAASRQGHAGIVQKLIHGGASINAQSVRYGNPLYAASEGGHEGAVETLIQSGADVNAQGGAFHSALHAASRAGHGGTVRILLQNGANTGVWAARAAASSRGHEEIAKLLRGYDTVK